MNREDKQLLLKDLCARLPYGVILNALYKGDEGWKWEDTCLLGIYKDEQVYLDNGWITYIEDIKPYLRSMSSITEEEKEALVDKFNHNFIVNKYGDLESVYKLDRETAYYEAESMSDWLDWLNSHHFDYHGLIPKGLALEVTEENNPYK